MPLGKLQDWHCAQLTAVHRVTPASPTSVCSVRVCVCTRDRACLHTQGPAPASPTLLFAESRPCPGAQRRKQDARGGGRTLCWAVLPVTQHSAPPPWAALRLPSSL